ARPRAAPGPTDPTQRDAASLTTLPQLPSRRNDARLGRRARDRGWRERTRGVYDGTDGLVRTAGPARAAAVRGASRDRAPTPVDAARPRTDRRRAVHRDRGLPRPRRRVDEARRLDLAAVRRQQGPALRVRARRRPRPRRARDRDDGRPRVDA